MHMKERIFVVVTEYLYRVEGQPDEVWPGHLPREWRAAVGVSFQLARRDSRRQLIFARVSCSFGCPLPVGFEKASGLGLVSATRSAARV